MKRDKVCEYFPCPVSKKTGRDCADFGDCQAKRFYDKYITNQEEMEYLDFIHKAGCTRKVKMCKNWG